ncbi:hypothetical protein [Burkholderia contaminans]|uniref:hypothetical protein n=1 Tax=Burkholderia contaminans TaxID=488447 RepID=UPI002157E059|nr:hypothetical protein [Burkholderia contaminans]
MGRYINQDPIGLAGGRNSYTYVDDRPSHSKDSLGLQTVALGAMGGGAVAGPLGALVGAVAGGIVLLAWVAWYAMSGKKDSVIEETKTDCPSNSRTCPPCKTVTGRIVARGAFGYRPLDVIPDGEMQHGVYGSHHNMFIANQKSE